MPEPRAVSDAHTASVGIRHAGQNSKSGRPDSKGARLAHHLGRLIFFLTLLLIFLTAIPYGSVEVWWTSFFEIGVFALTALWVLEALLGDGWHLRRQHWLALPPFALILFSLLQTISVGRTTTGEAGEVSIARAISADPFETLSFALRLAALTLLGALLLRFTTNRTRLNALVLTIIGVGAASAIFGILRQAMQHETLGFVLPALPLGVGYGQIISRNQFAFMSEMALGLALGIVFRRGGGYAARLVYLSPVLLIGAALILANSRGGIFTLMCQLLFLALLVIPASFARVEKRTSSSRTHAHARRLLSSLAARFVLIVVLLSLVSVAVVWIGGERVVSNLSTVQQEFDAEDAATRWNTRRVDIWRATWEMIKDHPLAGVGFGGYWTAIPKYHDASGQYTPQQAHNDYLELLASGGLIGLALALCFAFIFLRRARQVLLHADSLRRAASFGALVGLFGVAVHSLFDFGLHITINAALFVALVSISTADVPCDAEKRTKAVG
jgi:O-antigen ligase